MATSTSGEFERALQRLEEIVTKLEGENPSLDESVALFREGRELAAKCEQLLKAAQASIDKVTNAESAGGNAPQRNVEDGLPF